jgi:hypothetical protein
VRLNQACERWIYTTCLCFALELEEQKRSGFRYQYSNYQVEYSRNLIFEIGGHMEVRVQSNQAESECGAPRAAYDLKKLRGKEIVRRIGQTRRYQSTSSGLKAMVALVVLRNKAIKPLLAAAQDLRPSRGAQNPRPLDRNYEIIRTAMQVVFQELGLAA